MEPGDYQAPGAADAEIGQRRPQYTTTGYMLQGDVCAGGRTNVLAKQPFPFIEKECSESVPTSIVAIGDVAQVDRAQRAELLEASSPQGDDFKGDQNPLGINKGVVDTKAVGFPSKRACVTLDWLTLTIPREVVDLAQGSPYTLVDLLGLPVAHIIEEGHGESGYTALYTLDVPGARLRVGGNAGTASLQLSGSALTHFKKEIDLFGALVYWAGIGVRATRLDWAFDDFAGQLDFNRLVEGIRKGGDCVLKSPYRSTPQLQGSKVFGGNDWTIYIGSKSSSTRVRIYEKTSERESKGATLEEIGKTVYRMRTGRDDEDDVACVWIPRVTRPHWIRTELQLRQDAAAKAFESWVNKEFETDYALSILTGRVSFRIPNENDSNQSRWEVIGWWKTFVGYVKSLPIEVESEARDFEAMRHWLKTQVAKSLALLEDVCGADEVDGLINDGRSRYRKCDVAFRDKALKDRANSPPSDRFPGYTEEWIAKFIDPETGKKREDDLAGVEWGPGVPPVSIDSVDWDNMEPEDVRQVNLLSEQLERREILENVAWAMGAF
jgi:DNA relaxase NicK